MVVITLDIPRNLNTNWKKTRCVCEAVMPPVDKNDERPPPLLSFEEVYCYICSRCTVAVTRHWIIFLVLLKQTIECQIRGIQFILQISCETRCLGGSLSLAI